MRPERRPARPERATPLVGSWGVRLAWVSGLVLSISAFTDWYAGTLPNGLTLSVTGWHTGALGKLVFFVGLATLILEASREAGILLPAAVPDRLLLIALGALAVIFVLIRLISVPDTYFVSAAAGSASTSACSRHSAYSAPGCSAPPKSCPDSVRACRTAASRRRRDRSLASYTGRIALACSTSSSRSKPLPTKPLAPLDAA